ncbi:MAG: YabP/YqfC family sporulation protein [Bacilli bacterium]|nr:YabP/YqfC family sporulation protein [Bacilli bacterium]
MFTNLKNYILENDFKMIIFDKKVDIVNYDEIDHFDDNKIIIRNKEKIVIIKGEELVISKLLEDEMLIFGKVNGIEFK